MSALTDYLASDDYRDEVKVASELEPCDLAYNCYSEAELYHRYYIAALNAVCEQLQQRDGQHEVQLMRADNLMTQRDEAERKWRHAEAGRNAACKRIRELEAENARLFEMLQLVEADEGMHGLRRGAAMTARDDLTAAGDALAALAHLAIGYKARVDELESARQCGAENPHGMIPRKCPSCGEEMIPLPCMHLAMDSYKDGKRWYVEAARDLAHDHILQLETERDTARGERDRARDVAVGLEQECAKLDAMLKLAVMTWTAGCDPDVIDVPQFVHVTDAMEWLRAELEAAP